MGSGRAAGLDAELSILDGDLPSVRTGGLREAEAQSERGAGKEM